MCLAGVVKLDLHTGETAGRWQAPDGWHLVSEPTFVPRVGSTAADGDEGYLLVFVSSAARGSGVTAEGVEPGDGRASRLYVIDAKAMKTNEGDAHDVGAASGAADITVGGRQTDPHRLSGATVAALALPGAVPYGLHSCWLPYEELPPAGSFPKCE